jgi:hypothetical protein
VDALALILKNNDKKSRVATVINLIFKIPKPVSFWGTGCVKDAIDLKENTDLVIISKITKRLGKGGNPSPPLIAANRTTVPQ